MYDFKTFGQMNLDIIFKDFSHMPERGEEVFARLFDMQLGGGPMLYPVILNNIGLKTKLGTFLAEDEISNICRNLLNKVGYQDYENFYTGNDKPVVVTSVFSLAQDRSFIAFNQGINEAQLSENEVYTFLQDAKVISAPIGHAQALKKLFLEGKKIVFDVGWNELLSADKLKSLLQYVTVFAPNDKEALKLTGKETLEEAIVVLKNYTSNPIITTGKNGCMFYDNGVKYIPACEQFQSVDTTGAGDNFIAGIIYGLVKEYPLQECIRLGNIFAGYSTTKLGCYGALVTSEIIDTFYVNNN